jgi:hypothetical protein
LEERYGKDGLLLVIDEGPGYTDDVGTALSVDETNRTHAQFYGAPFALPAMGEKGYLDIKVCVHCLLTRTLTDIRSPSARLEVYVMARLLELS